MRALRKLDEIMQVMSRTKKSRDKKRCKRESWDNPDFPGTYVMSMTYEIVDEESAAMGDAKERGWEYEDEEYDSLEELLDDVQDKASWVEWSSSHPRPGDWIRSEAEQDYSTGEWTTYDLFIKKPKREPLTREEMKYISKYLGLR